MNIYDLLYHFFLLSILGIPTVHIKNELSSVLEGTDAVFEISCNSNESSKRKWTKYNKENRYIKICAHDTKYVIDKSTGALTVKNCNVADSGAYICKTRNCIGIGTKSKTTLKVSEVNLRIDI